MIELLRSGLVDYLNKEKEHLPPFDGRVLTVKNEVIPDREFDIDDKKPTIKQPKGTGSVTYLNGEDNSTLLAIDYEDLLNQFPKDHRKGEGRCDFIVYENVLKELFVLNELSKSEKAQNKRKKAITQLHHTLFVLYSIPSIKTFISAFPYKYCIFSNRSSIISPLPKMVDSFNLVLEKLPSPKPIKFQPIEKLGFWAIETDLVEVKSLKSLSLT
jgi:hypothetical protein